MKPVVGRNTSAPNPLLKKLYDVPVWRVALMLVLLLIPANYEQIFLRGSIITDVGTAELPLECTSRDIGLPLPVYRSSIPEPSRPYCGVVITENGPFRVIENGMVVIGAMSRHDIVDKLRPGCSVKLHYFGWGGPPERKRYYTTKPTRWIYAVESINECAQQPIEGKKNE